MKKFIIITTSLLTILSCGNKDPKPEPELEEYFSFYADGEYFSYPQKYMSDMFGDAQTLQATKLGSTSYRIVGYSLEDPLARGAVSMYFPGAHLPESDTVIITSAALIDFKFHSNNFVTEPPLKGKVIFTERSSSKLTGTFEFDAFHVNYDGTGDRTVTDTIIKITGGKFSIIPTN